MPWELGYCQILMSNKENPHFDHAINGFERSMEPCAASQLVLTSKSAQNLMGN